MKKEPAPVEPTSWSPLVLCEGPQHLGRDQEFGTNGEAPLYLKENVCGGLVPACMLTSACTLGPGRADDEWEMKFEVFAPTEEAQSREQVSSAVSAPETSLTVDPKSSETGRMKLVLLGTFVGVLLAGLVAALLIFFFLDRG